MDEPDFRRYLRREGRTEKVAHEVVTLVGQFAEFLQRQREGKGLTDAEPDDLEAFVARLETTPGSSAKTHLWAIRYYYAYIQDDEMRTVTAALREERISRAPFPLADFRGVAAEDSARLAAAGIRNVTQMLAAGRTPAQRVALAQKTGVSLRAIEDLVKLSDLARIPGVKGIRARLYVDAGFDTLDKLAACETEALRAALIEFVTRTGFEGIAPLPKEAAFTVAQARKLPRVIELAGSAST